jgi:ATP-binding cassette subfamily B protein
MLMSLVAGIMTLVQPLFVNMILDRLSKGAPLGLVPALLIVSLALATLITMAQAYLLLRASEGIILGARKKVLAKVLRLPIEQYDKRDLGDLTSRATADTAQLRSLLTDGMAESLGSIVVIVGAGTAMALIDPLLFAVAAVAAGTMFAVMFLISRTMRRTSEELQASVGSLSARLLGALASIRTIRSSGATAREEEVVEGIAHRSYRLGIRLARTQAVVAPLANIALQVAFLLVLAFGGTRVANESLSVSDLVTFILFLLMMMGPVGSSFSAVSSAFRALGSVARLDEIERLSPEEIHTSGRAEISHASRDSQDTEGLAVGIEFRDVVFSYEQTSFEPKMSGRNDSVGRSPGGRVLNGMSFTAKPGQVTAFVGESGGGKSTIFALIERFYEPESGRILIAGEDVASLPRSVLRSFIGYVEQDAPTVPGTFRDNLTLGAPGASDDQCWEALEQVNLTHVLARSKEGLSAPVGERGVLLSGGERQRLALARVILSDRRIVLLDESTSNLDSINEELLTKAIRTTSRDRTVLMIAHRLSTVYGAESILVVEGGKIAAAGTHDSLIRSSSTYEKLVRMQSGNPRMAPNAPKIISSREGSVVRTPVVLA